LAVPAQGIAGYPLKRASLSGFERNPPMKTKSSTNKTKKKTTINAKQLRDLVTRKNPRGGEPQHNLTESGQKRLG
jgi:hypothetical protein